MWFLRVIKGKRIRIDASFMCPKLALDKATKIALRIMVQFSLDSFTCIKKNIEFKYKNWYTKKSQFYLLIDRKETKKKYFSSLQI